MRRLSITGQLVRYVSLVLLDIAARGNSKKRRLIVNLGVFNFEYTFFIVSSVLNVNDKVNKFLGLCDVRKIGQFFASY